MAQAPSRLWIIRHNDQSKPQAIVKFDTAGETQIPDEVANHDTFQIIKVTNRSALTDQQVDQSALTEVEKNILSQVYPVR